LDQLIYGPSIYTMDIDSPVVEAVGVTDGKIDLVGSKEDLVELKTQETEVINPRAGSMFPGFVDNHVHFLDIGLYELFYVDLSETSSKKELLEMVRGAKDREGSGEWLLGMGWDESDWVGDKKFPTREELDRVVSDRPVALQRVDMHTFVVNSRGIDKLNIDPSTEGAATENGEFTGIFSENASLKVKQAIAPDVKEATDALRESVNQAHRKGVTSINQMVVDPGEFGNYFGAYRRLNDRDELRVHSRIYFTENYLDQAVNLGLETGFGDDWLRIGGLKLFTDGSIGSRTAWISKPYKGEPDNTGMSMWDTEKLLGLMKKADRNGIQLGIHAIGDRAIGQVISCMEEIVSEDENKLRHRIEHCEMPSDEQIEKMAKLGIIASMQPNFIGKWGKPGTMYEERFGKERLPELNKLKVFKDRDVPLSFSSDGMPFGPLFGIHWAVNAPFDTQRLCPESAIRAYTLDAAYVEGTENKIGSIEPGKYADFVLLDENPIKNPEKIKDMNVEMTFVEGEVVYSNK